MGSLTLIVLSSSRISFLQCNPSGPLIARDRSQFYKSWLTACE